MFSVQIHTVQIPEPIRASTSTITELYGVAHLFRYFPPITTASSVPWNQIARSPILFIVAVPKQISDDDFLGFCGSHLEQCSETIFLRNDNVEGSYSVLIRFQKQLAADQFYRDFNWKKFPKFQTAICHIYFVQSMECTDLEELSSTPPPGFSELPTCALCLERLGQDVSGIPVPCSCSAEWSYLSCQVCKWCQQLDDKPACALCGSLENFCVCMICGFTGCGRHAKHHWSKKHHRYFFEVETQQVCDYVRLNQSKADGKSVTKASRTCCYDKHYQISSKVEGIVNEYIHHFVNQMKTKMHYYMNLVAETENRMKSSISKARKEAKKKAVSSGIKDIQAKLDKCCLEVEDAKTVIQNLEEAYKAQKERVREMLLRDRSLVDEIGQLEVEIDEMELKALV